MKIENCKIENFSRKGLTFIELIVVIAIIGVMSAVVLVNTKSSKSQKAVEVAARDLAASIREMQNNALAGKQIVGNPIECGWGIYADTTTNKYKTFYKTACTDPQYKAVDDAANSIEKVLQNKVKFEVVDNYSFFFVIPYGKAKLAKSGSIDDTAGVKYPLVLVSDDGTAKYTVCVYESGKVEEKPGNVACP